MLLSHRYLRGNSSSGRARPCQGRGSEFEPRFPLHLIVAEWQSGYAAVCKTVYAGSIPTSASINLMQKEFWL